MEVSRIQFSQATKAALNARPMSKQAKAKLRRERVKDYIRSQPLGTIIKQSDLAVVAGYDKSQGHGWAFINRMIAKKHINKDTSEGSQKPTWTVNGDSHTVKRGKPNIITVKNGEMKIPPEDGEVTIPEHPMPLPKASNPDINAFVADMQRLGVEFTITITNKKGE